MSAARSTSLVHRHLYVILTILLVLPSTEATSPGLTEDTCETTADCLSPRLCIHFSSLPVRGCDAADPTGCLCLPEKGFSTCSNSTECVAGERCMRSEAGSTYCRSCTASADNVTVVDEVECITPTTDHDHFNHTSVTAQPDAQPNGGGVTRPSPSANSSRISLTASVLPSTLGSIDESPVVADESPVATGAAATNPTQASAAVSTFVLASASPTVPTTTEDAGVCVDEKLLRHMSEEELVYERHVHARVLCDLQGSCATDRHMVMWHGQAMTMRGYCTKVRCEEDERLVNSPRMQRGVRLPSRTYGLEMTALAARWDTWVERQVLGALIWLGM